MIESSENIWFNINRLKWSNKITNRCLSDILNITESEFKALYVARKAPGLTSLTFLAQHFEISLDELMHSRIRVYKALRKKQFLKVELPEKFLIAAHSKVRTSYHIINYLEQKNKFNLIEQFLNHTKVPYRIFENLSNQINIEFITELCNWLARNYLVSANDLYQTGLNTFEVNRHSEMADKLATFSNLKDLHLFQINEFMDFFDRNAHYRVKSISDSKCIASWTHNQEVCEGLKKKRTSSLQVEIYQLGVAASFPLFLKLPPSKVKMLSSIHGGDKETVFEIDFSRASNLLKKNSLEIVRKV